MSDNFRRYQAIKTALFDLYPQPVQGRQRQSLTVLAMFINGIVASGSTHLREVAKKAPGSAKANSRQKQLYRWYENEKNGYDAYFLPFVEALLLGLSDHTYVLAIDGSVVGRGCVCLMVTLIYQNRAIPLAWQVIQGEKGHFPANMHIDVLKQVEKRLPKDASVVVIGDGEFDSVALQQAVAQLQWDYVCRTASNLQVYHEGEWVSLSEIGVMRGSCLTLADVAFSQQAYGPVTVILWWRQDEQTPIYLVTNFELTAEACRFYKKRMRIETFFSDQKSRGFHLHKSHITDPQRLARLLIAACLAYIWIIFLGTLAKVENWIEVIHRTDRCDLSLFQLGLDLLEHFLTQEFAIPVDFRLFSPEFVT
jgi:hypothetical protein